jgi:anti-sigma B factor antagonist
MDLVVRQTRVGALNVVHLAGEVDLATLPKMSDALVRAVDADADATVVVDLDGVQLLDDAGLGLLLGAAGRARRRHGDVIVVCSPGTLRRHLALTGFDRAVRVVETLADAT